MRRLRRLPSEAVHGIDALTSLLEGPEPKTYDFQSGGVLQMLEGLQDKFVDERSSLEKEEQAERHSYEARSACILLAFASLGMLRSC